MTTGSPLASEPPIRSLAATPQAMIAGLPVPNGRRTTLRSVVRTRQGRTDCSSGEPRALAPTRPGRCRRRSPLRRREQRGGSGARTAVSFASTPPHRDRPGSGHPRWPRRHPSRTAMAAPDVPPIRIPDGFTAGAASDLHGQLRAVDLLLGAAGLTDGADRWSAPRATALVVTGDVVDRGPDCVGLVRRLASLRVQAERAGGCGA